MAVFALQVLGLKPEENTAPAEFTHKPLRTTGYARALRIFVLGVLR